MMAQTSQHSTFHFSTVPASSPYYQYFSPTHQPTIPSHNDFALYDTALALVSQQPQHPQQYHQPLTHFHPIVPTPPNSHSGIKVQTSHPGPPSHSVSEFSTHSAFPGSSRQQDWQMYAAAYNSMGGPATSQHLNGVKRAGTHQRTPSASTVASNGPASPYMQNAQVSYPHVANTDTSPDSPAYYGDQSFAKNLPTPSQTPTESVFANSAFSLHQFAQTPNAHLAMKDFGIHHHAESDYPSDFAPSRQSMSSYGNDSPATPQSGVGDVDMKSYNVSTNGEIDAATASDFYDGLLFNDADARPSNPNVQLFRSESQAYQDELYNPNTFTSVPTTMPKAQQQNTFLSPHRSLMSQRLETANLNRSTSPTSVVSRERSPFRDGSPLAPAGDWRSPAGTVGTVAHMRQQQKEQAEQAEYKRKMPPLNREATKTISPKDALLEYHETDQQPLFQDNLPAGYDTHRGSAEQWPTTYNAFGGLPATSQQNMGFRHAIPTANGCAGSGFDFQLPQGSDQINGNPFQTNYHAQKINYSDNTPDFPAALPSMETSVSDVGPGPSSQEDTFTSMSHRPDDTRANTGTYTCTYHNCTQRFDSHNSLQKHKRESHRPQPPAPLPQQQHQHQQHQQQAIGSSPSEDDSASARSSVSPAPSASGMTSAAILARNSQAGPHKCARINPSTGKPCNTIFSRPYDLTRHEDTIHNGRKQKVKCPYCREEKTFSRSDALTRHMRVVHPEVESYGKRGRRGD